MLAIVKTRQETLAHDGTVSIPHSTLPGEDNYQAQPRMSTIDTLFLVRGSFLLSPPEDIQRLYFKIVKVLYYQEYGIDTNPDQKWFMCSSQDGTTEEIMSCTKSWSIQNEEDENQVE